MVAAPGLLPYLLVFRWASFLAGLVMVGLSQREPSMIPALVSKIPQLVIFGLAIYQIAASAFFAKGVESRFTFALLLFSDVACGCFLIYFYGSSFFLMAAVVPLLETAYFYSVGTLYSACLLGVTVFPLLIVDQLNAITTREIPPHVILRGLAVQGILGIMLLWLFLKAKMAEIDLDKQRKRGVEEKRVMMTQMESLSKDMERLYQELLGEGSRREDLQREKDLTVSRIEDELEGTKIQFQRERERLLRQIAQAHEEAEGVQEKVEKWAKAFASSTTFQRTLASDEVMISLAETLGETFPCQTCVIFLMEEEGGRTSLVAEVAAGPYADYFRNFHAPISEGVVGWVAQEITPILISQGKIKPSPGLEFSTLIINERSAMVAPLLKEEQVIGAVYLGAVKEGAFSEEDLMLFSSLASQGACAISNALEHTQKVSQGVSDKKSGLYNQIFFEARLSEEVKRAIRYSLPLSLIYLEIDRYGAFKEKYGTSFTDLLLGEMGEIMKSYTREIDVAARMQSERFALLLIQAQKSNAILIAERIRMAVEMRLFGTSTKERVKLTVSIGVAACPEDARSRHELVEKAESSIREAKGKGGNKTCFVA